MFMAHHSPTGMGRGGSMVRTALAIRVNDVRSIQDLGASAKRKEIQPFSSSKKKKKTYVFTRISGTGPWPPGSRPRSIIQGWGTLQGS